MTRDTMTMAEQAYFLGAFVAHVVEWEEHRRRVALRKRQRGIVSRLARSRHCALGGRYEE